MSPCPGALCSTPCTKRHTLTYPSPAASWTGGLTCQLVLRVSTFVPSLSESNTLQLRK